MRPTIPLSLLLLSVPLFGCDAMYEADLIVQANHKPVAGAKVSLVCDAGTRPMPPTDKAGKSMMHKIGSHPSDVCKVVIEKATFDKKTIAWPCRDKKCPQATIDLCDGAAAASQPGCAVKAP